MQKATRNLTVRDCRPAADRLRDEVLRGLRSDPKHISPKFFYDERGSRLFDRICELEEYYPTRTELGIMRGRIDDIAPMLGSACLLIEFGSGSSVKTRILLDHLDSPAAYVPLDISKEHLQTTAKSLSAAYPDLDILPVCADFTQAFDVPDCEAPVSRRVVYFPGSTLGNLEPDQAVALLKKIREVVSPGGGLLIGVDMKKDRAILERAYDDAEGVTARFNKNVLMRLNRELGADFELDQFRHRAVYNEAAGRIEMHLVSKRLQIVHFKGDEIRFEAGETIHTESSHKFTPAEFAALAATAGFTVKQVWTDEKRLFSVQYLTVTAQ
ncbi:MAG: L-histidine N(alpha)-methyltransferase [Phycisphaerae bacterium]